MLEGVVIVGGSVAVTLAVMLLVRRSVRLTTLERHNEVVGFVYAVLGLIYAVMLAFVVIIVWQQFETARPTRKRKRTG